MNTYGYARDMLQDRGYKVLVDGVSPLALQFFDPANLRPDFIKVAWGKEFEEESTDSTKLKMLSETVQHAGKDSIIVYRVDSERAVKWGLSLGISRFQGYFIDKLVHAMTRPKVQPKVPTGAGPAKAGTA
jgi:c-di-GMP-related signal transduction protein